MQFPASPGWGLLVALVGWAVLANRGGGPCGCGSPVEQLARRCGTVYTVPKDVKRLSQQYGKMLDATYSSTRRTIMLYCVLLLYCYYSKHYHTIVLYTFIFFLLVGFHLISNFAEIAFRKCLTSLSYCRVGIPFFGTRFCTPSKSFSLAPNVSLGNTFHPSASFVRQCLNLFRQLLRSNCEYLQNIFSVVAASFVSKKVS